MKKKPAPPRPGGKKATSYRMSEEATDLLRQLSERLAVPQSAILELLVREKAKKEGLR